MLMFKNSRNSISVVLPVGESLLKYGAGEACRWRDYTAIECGQRWLRTAVWLQWPLDPLTFFLPWPNASHSDSRAPGCWKPTEAQFSSWVTWFWFHFLIQNVVIMYIKLTNVLILSKLLAEEKKSGLVTMRSAPWRVHIWPEGQGLP